MDACLSRWKDNFTKARALNERNRTTWKNRDEKAALLAQEASRRAAGPFEGLNWIEQINIGMDYFQNLGRVSSGTWLFDHRTLARLRKQPAKKRLTWITDRIRKALHKALVRHPALIVTLQLNEAGYEHVHVICDLALDEHDPAEKALGTKGCCGTWKAKPTGKRRGTQFDTEAFADEGWTRYITRHRKVLARGDFYMNGEFRDAAVQHHEARRQAARAKPQVLNSLTSGGRSAPADLLVNGLYDRIHIGTGEQDHQILGEVGNTRATARRMGGDCKGDSMLDVVLHPVPAGSTSFVLEFLPAEQRGDNSQLRADSEVPHDGKPLRPDTGHPRDPRNRSVDSARNPGGPAPLIFCQAARRLLRLG
jgi:hypothetical protein